MNLEQLLLIKLMEECAEVQQACSKALRFSLNEKCSETTMTNAKYITEEVKDVLAVLKCLEAEGILPMPELSLEERIHRRTRIYKYMDYTRELGILE